MNRTKKQIRDIIEEAKEIGAAYVVIDGVQYVFSDNAKSKHVPDTKAEDLIKQLSTFEEPSDEEVLYWSSPYYDELESKKKHKAQLEKEQGDK